MLSNEIIEKLTERIVNRIEQGNEYILKKMGESVKKIRTLNRSQAHELEMILKYGGDYEKIEKKLAEITKLNVKDIRKIFREVAKSDYEFAEQFYNYRKIKYIPFDENIALQNFVDALSKKTTKEYLKLTNRKVIGFGLVNEKTKKITFKGLKRVYYNLIDEGIFNILQGKETFDNYMYRKLKEIGASGVKVKYESGATRRLDTVIRMNIEDGLSMLRTETQRRFGKEFDSDGVEITVHLNPAPDHQFVQGRQFSTVAPNKNELSEFDKFQNDQDAVSYDGIEFPATSEETGYDRRSIGQYNCKHDIYSIVLGVNQPQYTNEQLQEIIDSNNKGFDFEGKHYNTVYEGTQLQRQIETKIRELKETQILARASGEEDLINHSQKRITLLTKKYRDLSKAAQLSTRMDRMRVPAYKRVAIKK